MFRVTGSLQPKNGILHTVLVATEIKEDGKSIRSAPIWKTTKLPEKGGKRQAKSLLLQRIAELEQSLNTLPTENIPPVCERPGSEQILSSAFVSSKLEKISPQASDEADDPQNPYFSDYMKMWLQIMKNTVQTTTYGSYQYYVLKRICPYFEERKIRLKQLTALDIQGYYNSVMERGAKWNSVSKHHANIHKALSYAVITLKWIPFNPADHLELPRAEKFIGGFYNEEELNTLFEKIEGDPLEIPVLLAAFYGLSRSEVLGLKWDAIDFTRRTFCIKHTVCKATIDGKTKIIQKDTAKRKSRYRTLPLVEQMRVVLYQEWKRQQVNKQWVRKGYNHAYDGYICVNSTGDILKPDYISQHFALFLKKHSLRKIRFHDLRHSCASLLLANGVSLKEIQEWLGHSNYATTADIYSHLEYKSKISSASTVDQKLRVGDKYQILAMGE